MRFCAARTRLIVTNVVFFSLLFGTSTLLHGQRENVIGATVDVVGGLDNSPQLNLPVFARSDEISPFYSINPAVGFVSRGGHSQFEANYAFGWSRYQTELPSEPKSHSVSATLTSQVAARWSLDFGGSYSVSDDLQSFYALRGIALVNEDFVYLFEPVAAHTIFRTGRGTVGLRRAFSQRSSLSITGEHSLRGYDGRGLENSLSDQESTTGTVSYSRRFNERLAWVLEYSGTYHNFDDFNDALTNVARTGLTYNLARTTTLRFNGGPSVVSDPGSPGRIISYEAQASLEQQVKENRFHFTFSQDNGGVTGLGSVSKTRRATVGFVRDLTARINVFADATGYESTGILDNDIDTKGLSASGNIGFSLTDRLSLQGGVQVQRYSRPDPYQFTQKRVFVSLRYSHANLLRWR